MIVTFGIAKLSDGKIRLEVARPQHTATAHHTYSSLEAVRRVLSNLGVPSEITDFYFQLLPKLDSNQLLQFPPLHITEHQLAAEGLKTEWKNAAVTLVADVCKRSY